MRRAPELPFFTPFRRFFQCHRIPLPSLSPPLPGGGGVNRCLHRGAGPGRHPPRSTRAGGAALASAGGAGLLPPTGDRGGATRQPSADRLRGRVSGPLQRNTANGLFRGAPLAGWVLQQAAG